MNQFALPRAIVDFEHRRFVAWNPTFLETTSCSDEELKTFSLENILSLGESWSPISETDQSKEAEYVPCVTKRPFDGAQSPGYIVRARGRIGYVMLDNLGASADFEQGKTVGRDEERNRIAKVFHNEVSSSVLAALFLIEVAKAELERAGLPQAEVVAKASDILAETTEKIASVVTDADK